MSVLVPLVTSTGPLLDRASARVKALVDAVSGKEDQYFEEGQFNPAHVKKELQDTNEEVKIRALKRLLAAHASGVDVAMLLPEVVKAIAVPSLEMKRLVYLFLILHAERSRDVALLSINSFQKDLADRNQLIRATSLKALASIHLLEVVQLLMAALRRAAADSSPFVRRTAAQCIMKVYTLDPDQFQELLKIVLTLLKDIEISVVGAALVAFRELSLRHGAADCLRLDEEDQLSSQHPAQCWSACAVEEQQQHAHHPSGQHLQQRKEKEENERGEDEKIKHRTEQGMLSDPHEHSTGYNNKGWEKSAWNHVRGTQAIDGEQWMTEGKRYTEGAGHGDAYSESNCQRGNARYNNYDTESASAASTSPLTAEGFLSSPNKDLPDDLPSYATTAAMKNRFRAQVCALRLLHPHYRRLQESMLQLEPYAQVVAIDVLLRYVRLFFADPAAALHKQNRQRKQQTETQQLEQQRETRSFRDAVSERRCIGRGEKEKEGSEMCTYEAFITESPENHLPADLRMFLLNLAQLLYSESVAVVGAVATAFYYLLPPSAWKPVVQPLLRCIYTSSVEVRETLLHITAAFAAAAPALFLPYFRNFFLMCNDPSSVKQGKLLVLRRLLFSPLFEKAVATTEEAVIFPSLLLHELSTYIRWPGNPSLLSACFSFLVDIAMRFPSAQSSCMQIFVQLLDTTSSCALASEAILALQVVLQQQQQQLQQQEQQQRQEGKSIPLCHDTEMGVPGVGIAVNSSDTNVVTNWTGGKISFRGSDNKMKTKKGQQLGWLVLQLAMHLSRFIQGAAARASIVWMVGEYQQEVGWVAADVFRQLTKHFTTEAEEVKLQILLLGLKVWAFHWVNKQLLHGQQQQEDKRSSPEDEEVDRLSRGKAVTQAQTVVSSEAAHDSDKRYLNEEGEKSEITLLCNGVIVSAVADARGEQQERTTTHNAADPDKEKTMRTSTAHVTKQPHLKEKGEEHHRYLLPPPTPEESAKAFPRLDNMLKYVCEAASFDMSYDVRDVARLYFALSRLAVAGEAHRKRESGTRNIRYATSKHNRCVDHNSTASRNNVVHQNDNSTTSSSNEENNDVSDSVEGSNNPPSSWAQEREMLQGLSGCGGEMFESTSSEAIADMCDFAQQYMRSLAMAFTGGRKIGMQSRAKTRDLGRRAAGILAAAPAQGNVDRIDACLMMRGDDERDPYEPARQPLRDNKSLSSTGWNTSRSGTVCERYSCCEEEDHNARGDFVRRSSSLLLGSLSELLRDRMHGYIELPPFAAIDSPDELRTVERTVAPPGVVQCLTRGRNEGGAYEEGSGTLLSNHYVDIQEVKAISSDCIVIKRSAAALMGKDTDAKADFTPLDLDSFYADNEHCTGVSPGGLQRGNGGVIPSVKAATPACAASVSEAGNSFASLSNASNTSFLSSRMAVSSTLSDTQQEKRLQPQQQQQSLWDMFGETHVQGGGEWSVQPQRNDNQSVAQFEARAVAHFTCAEEAATKGSTDIFASAQGREREGGVAVAGEDEESDEEKLYFADVR